MTKDKKNCLLCHFNFSPVVYENFRSGVLCPGTYTEIFNSNAEEYGGDGITNPEPIEAEKIGWDFKEYSIGYKLGSFGVSVFKFDYVEPKKPEPIIDETALKIEKKKPGRKKKKVQDEK